MVTEFILIMTYVSHITMLHTLNLYSALCLLHPNKTENK